MVRALTRRSSIQNLRSFNIQRQPSGRLQQNLTPDGNGAEDVDDNSQSRSIIETRTAEDQSMEKQDVGGESGPCTPREKPQSDMELMKERFAKLLLGEDMSGGGKGVSSAVALSNAVTNLAASVFGEKGKLEPMAPERKARWRKEMDWFLSVTDHIVEFVPSQQKSKDGSDMEIMVTRQRSDLLVNIPALRKLDNLLIETLDDFGQEKEFWYVSKNDDQDKENRQGDDKWWHPTVKVPANGLSESSRRWLQSQKESMNQVLKASMNINAEILSEIEIPESYVESLPKNGRECLGDSIYRSITVEYFDPAQFLSAMDLSTEHKVLDLKNRIEASINIWKRKMHQKDGKSSWGSSVSLEKRELFAERAETILLLLKQRFQGLPQSALDISKIQENMDVGRAILESYSRILESMAYSVMSRIEDVLYADSLSQTSSTARSDMSPSSSLTQTSSLTRADTSSSSLTQTSSPARSDMSSSSDEDAARLSVSGTPTLSDFMGWNIVSPVRNSSDLEIYIKGDGDRKTPKPPLSPTPKIVSYLEKLENITGIRSPNSRDRD